MNMSTFICRVTASRIFSQGYLVHKDELTLKGREHKKFYDHKRKLVDHVVGVGLSGDCLLSALVQISKNAEVADVSAKKMTMIVNCAITIVKMKSAGVHLEQIIAFLASAGVDVGTIGHSR